MNSISLPIQKQLFDLIHSKFSLNKKRNWVRQYIKEAHLSKSAAYNRISAQKSISFDEGIKLMQFYQISPSDIARWRQTSSALESQIPAQSLIEQLTAFSTDLEQLSAIDADLWYFTHDIPFYLIMESPLLASFKFFNWQRNYSLKPGMDQQQFGREWMESPEVRQYLDLGKCILDSNNRIPSVEFWDANMFNRSMNQILYIQEIDLFAQRDLRSKLIAEMMRLAEHLEQMVISGFKQTAGRVVKVQVYENRIFQSSSVVCSGSPDVSFAYYEHDAPEFSATYISDEVQFRLNRLKSMPLRSSPLTLNEKERRQFFQRLKQNIRTYLMD
ncbi:hypothetical protein [Runella sp.]|uniref:hypothetical protein n=1 Tax=Runella sp. TaxID=1960881 RepID=UPI00301842B2